MAARGTIHQRTWICLAVLISSLFLLAGAECALAETQAAAAQDEEVAESNGEGRGHEDSGALIDLLARFINFALLVIILAVVLKKSNAFGFFSDRVEDIKKRMEQLQREKEEAEAKYHEVEAKLKDFETEKKDILESARKNGEVEKAKILEEAEKRVSQMMEQVELTIQQEVQAAKDRLKREVADLAAEQAQEMISKEMKEEDQDRLVSEFIERVGKVH